MSQARDLPDNGSARRVTRLGDAPRGFTGTISALAPAEAGSSLPDEELESHLAEFGFVEGAEVGILHEGVFGGDPIAVRVDGMTVAIRRREARAVLVTGEDRR